MPVPEETIADSAIHDVATDKGKEREQTVDDGEDMYVHC